MEFNTKDDKDELMEVDVDPNVSAMRAQTLEYKIKTPLKGNTDQLQVGKLGVDEDEEEKPMICKMYVKPGVTMGNVMMLFVVKLGIYILITFWNVALVDTLQDPDYYDINEDEIGRQSSYLLCGAYPFGFFGTIFFGYLFDAYDRRVTLSVSFALSGFSLYFVLLPAPDIYPWLFTIRCLFQFVLSGPWAAPIAADYVQPESMAKASIFGTLGMMAGNLIAYGIFLQMMIYIPDAQVTYTTTATFCLFIALILYIYVQNMTFREADDAEEADNEDKQINQEIKDMKKAAKRAGSALEVPRSSNSRNSGGGRSAITSNTSRGMSEQEFKQMGTCDKVTALFKQLYDACKKNNLITLGIVGGAICRCYNVFHNTFQFLYVCSFVDDGLYTQDEATAFYSYQTLVSLNIGVFVAIPMAVIMDKYHPKWTVWPVFFTRGTCNVLYCFIKNPSRWPTYVLQTVLFASQTAEIVVVDALMLRNAEKEIRGMIVGVQMGSSFLAQFFFALIGGFAFDLISPITPFIMLATLDYGMVITLLIMGFWTGTIKNDIEERRIEAELAAAADVPKSNYQVKKPASVIDRAHSINSDNLIGVM